MPQAAIPAIGSLGVPLAPPAPVAIPSIRTHLGVALGLGLLLLPGIGGWAAFTRISAAGVGPRPPGHAPVRTAGALLGVGPRCGRATVGGGLCGHGDRSGAPRVRR